MRAIWNALPFCQISCRDIESKHQLANCWSLPLKFLILSLWFSLIGVNLLLRRNISCLHQNWSLNQEASVNSTFVCQCFRAIETVSPAPWVHPNRFFSKVNRKRLNQYSSDMSTSQASEKTLIVAKIRVPTTWAVFLERHCKSWIWKLLQKEGKRQVQAKPFSNLKPSPVLTELPSGETATQFQLIALFYWDKWPTLPLKGR